MSWKDTVIKTHNPQILPEINQYQIVLLVKQAEISYKAGAKEERERIQAVVHDYFSLTPKEFNGKYHVSRSVYRGGELLLALKRRGDDDTTR
ncbi:hypothetical protein LCGC14_2379550 [marine sediment metagenome]|uniref:Uncharacterized protein n=1 Tax=marine sediment metagenome TaxID=412755 RepID=A0A0F9CNJ2_9ZZZZ